MFTETGFWILFGFATLIIGGSIWETAGYWALLTAPVGGFVSAAVIWFIVEKFRASRRRKNK